MKKTLLFSTFLISAFCCFQVSATDLTKALFKNKPLSEIQGLIQNGANVNQPDEKSGWYPLMYAKDVDTLKLLIQKGANVNAETEYISVFQQICATGTLEMVQEMVRAGADVNKVVGPKYMQDTPLMAALSNKDPRVLDFLIQSGADINAKVPGVGSDDTILNKAIIQNRPPEIFQLLLKHGATAEQNGKFDQSLYSDIAASSSYPELIPLFQKAGYDFSKEDLNLLFLKAINMNSSMNMAKYLIELGADPNTQATKTFHGHEIKEEFPIIVAARGVRPNTLQFLLDQNVNINVLSQDGKTPLQLLQKNQYLMKAPRYNQFIVALGGQAPSEDEAKRTQNSVQLLEDVSDSNKNLSDIQKLIQAGADVNYTGQYGDTPLSKALQILSEKSHQEFKEDGLIKNNLDYQSYLQERLKIADLLIANGADVHAKDKHGINLLFKVDDQPKILEYLLQKGLNPNSTNNNGTTPLMDVATTGNVESIKVLLKYGADKTLKNKSGMTALDHAAFVFNPEVQELLKIPTSVQKYDLPQSAEIFYEKTKQGILNKMILPKVQMSLEDPAKIPAVMKEIETSFDMDLLKSESWPCLSKLPESEWERARDCFPKKFMATLMQNALKSVTISNAGEGADLNDPMTSFAAIEKTEKIGVNRAMTRHYGNSLLMDASILALTAKAYNGGEGRDMSAADTLNDRKIACGATMFATKEGIVTIDLPDECIPMEETDKKLNISVDEVIAAALQESTQDYRSHEKFTCQGHRCTWQFK